MLYYCTASGAVVTEQMSNAVNSYDTHIHLALLIFAFDRCCRLQRSADAAMLAPLH
jgi:hypothetical protein